MRCYCFLLVLFLTFDCYAQHEEGKEVTLSPQEKELATQLNSYRESIGLDPIPVSVSLTHVAQVHVRDLMDYHKIKGSCNMHSWSPNGSWTSCCYTPDHAQAACMWNKPRELTQYTGNGFEIAFYSTKVYHRPGEQADDALNNWKASPGHYNVIANKGTWTNTKWKAMGVGVYGNYITVWFGIEADPAGYLSF